MSDEATLDISGLPEISLQAAEDYEQHGDPLIELVNEKLQQREDLRELIGDNSVQTMVENHVNHFRFMANVFKLVDYDLLVRTVTWVYKTYRHHGFSYDYFPVALKAWSEVIEQQLDADNSAQILKVYSFLLENHQAFVDMAQEDESPRLNRQEETTDTAERLLKALVAGDH